MICCIDSHTFIWGIKRKASPGQEKMIARAEYLFEWVDKNKYQVMIPTIVLAEVLAPEPLETYPVLMEKISKSFIIGDFDSKAASRYGQLLMNRNNQVKKIARENELDNQRMKVDHLIIACALANNAGYIYSSDKGLRAFGEPFIEIRELPELPSVQTNLFSQSVPISQSKS